jgi:hypothetical protein
MELAHALLIAFLAVYMTRRYSRRPSSLPPGPRGLPIIGNLLDMPAEKSWQAFAELGYKYGQLHPVLFCRIVFSHTQDR